jgi:hypothetical protein
VAGAGTEVFEPDDGPTLDKRHRQIWAYAIAFRILQCLIFLSAFRYGGGPALAFLCLIISSLISTLLHEAGHAIAAWAVGWRVVVFAVWPVSVRLTSWSIGFEKPGSGTDYLGWVKTIPAGPDKDTCRNWYTILAAGPATSLSIALAAFFFAFVWLPKWDTPNISVSTIGFGFAVGCVASFLFNVLPSARSHHETDGDQIRAMADPAYDYHKGRALIWLGTLVSANVRPRERSSWLLDAARLDHADNQEIAKLLDATKLARLLDSFEIDRNAARESIEAYRQKYGTDDWLTAIDAYVTACYDREPGAADAILAGWPRPETPTPMFVAAEAAVAAANGRQEEAKDRLRAMMKLVRAQSTFRDDTFRDISRQIGKLVA